MSEEKEKSLKFDLIEKYISSAKQMKPLSEISKFWVFTSKTPDFSKVKNYDSYLVII